MYDLEFYATDDEINKELAKIERIHRRKLITSPSKLSRAYGKVFLKHMENQLNFVLGKLLRGDRK